MENSKHEHQFGNITTDNGDCGKRLQLIRTCTSCGYVEVIGVQGSIRAHQFSECHIIKRSTCIEAGHASIQCVKCGQKKFFELPLSGHHYIRNNPFYEICCECHKKVPTPIVQRSLLILVTMVLFSSFIIGGMYLFTKKLQLTDGKYVNILNGSESICSSAVTVCSISGKDAATQTALTPLYIDNTYSFDIKKPELKSNTRSNALDDEAPETIGELDDAVALQTLPDIAFRDFSEKHVQQLQSDAFPEEYVHEEDLILDNALLYSSADEYNTIASQVVIDLNDIVNSLSSETDTPSDSNDIHEQLSEQSSLETVLVTSSPVIEAETSTVPSENTAADDYSWLIGEILNGSDLLKLVEAGMPVEIITNTGVKLQANVALSDAVPFSGIDMISVTDSYTANIIYIDSQQVIVLNQF